MTQNKISPESTAALIARFLKARQVKRVFALCGGHIMPIWMRLDEEGIEIIDVRDERAAVYMAHAHAELTGELGVALVTAGPGVTNAMTGIANAHVARASVLILSGLPPQAQENRGALQDVVHIDFVRPLTRYAKTVRVPELVLQELSEAVSRSLGYGSEPGPTYLDFPVDTLRAQVSKSIQLEEYFQVPLKPRLSADPETISRAVDLLWSAKKPLFISGRGAKGAGKSLAKLLEKLNALYLDTGESRGLIPDSHPSVVSATRGQVMTEADIVVTIGRRLDFQLAYGSPAIFGNAKFIRIADCVSELRDNRIGTIELLGDVELTILAMLKEAGEKPSATDLAWVHYIREKHLERSTKLVQTMQSAPAGKDGRMHPNRLISALRETLPSDSVIIADGGDFLSFARIGLPASQYLDPGSLGCIGIGTPFGVAASLALPDKTVVVTTGDGAFGFNAMEIDTAVRHAAPVLIVVANNGSWAIEVRDQQETHGKVVGTYLQFADYAAMARAFGMHAERVESPDALPDAIQRALTNRPALLDVVVTPEAASSDAKSGLAWVPDLQPLASWDTAEKLWREKSNTEQSKEF
jgi:acetolactate synthase I/II/III large subunit